MVRIVPTRSVALGPEALDERVRGPALEGEGAGFEALHSGVAGDASLFRLADAVVRDFLAGVEDCAGGPVVGARIVRGRMSAAHEDLR